MCLAHAGRQAAALGVGKKLRIGLVGRGASPHGPGQQTTSAMSDRAAHGPKVRVGRLKSDRAAPAPGVIGRAHPLRPNASVPPTDRAGGQGGPGAVRHAAQANPVHRDPAVQVRRAGRAQVVRRVGVHGARAGRRGGEGRRNA